MEKVGEDREDGGRLGKGWEKVGEGGGRLWESGGRCGKVGEELNFQKFQILKVI